MKRKTAVIDRIAAVYMIAGFLLFLISISANSGYFYRLAYDSLPLYQVKQVISVLVLYAIGYCYMKLIQDYFSDLWVALLAMPCGAALWVFASQALLLFNIRYTMPRVFLALGIVYVSGLLFRQRGYPGAWKADPAAQKRGAARARRKVRLPSAAVLFLTVGTAFLVSTGWNYINMNYDSYLYFANYGKAIAAYGNYVSFTNTENAFVLTNIGQFLPLLNSYAAFWGLEYCLPELSFLVFNMLAIFAVAVYEQAADIREVRKRAAYTLCSTAALAACTCVLVFADWMLSNAFIMYYLTIAGILGMRVPGEGKTDYALAVGGCGLAITLLRKDGIIVVCFLFVCYCCSRAVKGRRLLCWLLPSALVQLLYIGYVRLYLRAETHTARGTSILSNKFVFLLAAAVAMTFLYLAWLHPLFEKWLGEKLMTVILVLMLAAACAAGASTFWKTVDHIDAIMKVLVSPGYGFSLLLWLLPLAFILAEPVKMDYGIFLVIGYCILTFLIYWNKGNTEQGIDNSGMRAFVQIVPMIFYVESCCLKDRLFGREERGSGAP